MWDYKNPVRYVLHPKLSLKSTYIDVLEFSSIIFKSYALISALEINISILRWITGRIKKTYGKKNLYSWHEILRFQNLISHSFHSNLHLFLITIFFKTLTLKNNYSSSFAPVEIIGQLLSIPCWLQHDTPLHAPLIGVDCRLFFWQLQLLFDAQSLLQLHLISLSIVQLVQERWTIKLLSIAVLDGIHGRSEIWQRRMLEVDFLAFSGIAMTNVLIQGVPKKTIRFWNSIFSISNHFEKFQI